MKPFNILRMRKAAPPAVAQTLRPNSTISTSGLTNGGYADINEATANDSNEVSLFGSGATMLLGMTDPSEAVGSNPTLRYRARRQSGSPPLTIRILEGATERASTSQAISNGSHSGFSWVPDLSAVTNYNDLRVELGSPSAAIYVSWLELEILP
tara:strand:- start:98 stop:559 length:462 start_codon:yes stop_codon:yes gene_type:complete